MAIEISNTDVVAAEEFLASMLEQNIEDGKFTEGTALRDLAVKGLAFIHAYMKKENASVRAMQSLRSITNLSTTDDPELDRAVAAATDAHLSNWFVSRKVGQFSRGLVQVKVSRRQDYIVPHTQRFLYSRNIAFFLDKDTTEDLIIPASDLQAQITAQGVVEHYTMTLPLIAARTGVSYNVTPGEWQSAGTFSPYVLGGQSVETFAGGDARETTAALIERAPSAISERSLINERAISATLVERFGELIRLQVIGMGDPEMLRDTVSLFPADLSTHIGGHYDVFLELPIVERVFEGALGGTFTRPDNLATVFRDGTIADWTATDVQVGDMIRVSAGLPGAAKDFTIRSVLVAELQVSTGRPFSLATEDSSDVVDYYIYRPLHGADYQVLPPTGVNTTGVTSRAVSTSGRVLLPGGPVYDILDVSIIDPDAGDVNINGAEGFVHFPQRQNAEPFLTLEPEQLNYQVRSSDLGTAQSSEQYAEVLLPPVYDGKTVRITYETLAGYAAVDAFIKDRFERILVSSPLARGFHPVYLSFRVQYSLSPQATSGIDNTALREALVLFIKEFSSKDIIDTSDITTVVRAFSSQIGTVYPLDIAYSLMSPNGDIVQFETSDIVRVHQDKVTVEDATFFTDSAALGLSDRVIRYHTSYARITVEQI